MSPDERQAFIRADLGIIDEPDRGVFPAATLCPDCRRPMTALPEAWVCYWCIVNEQTSSDPRQDERAELERALRNLVAAYLDPLSDFDAHLTNAQDVLRGMDGP